MLTAILCLCLPLPAPAVAPVQAATAQQGPDPFVILTEQYAEDELAWRAAVKKARAEGAELPPHPATEYLEHFARMADRGDGRAWLWIADHLDAGGYRGFRRMRKVQECYRAVFEGFWGEPWMEQALLQFSDQLGDIKRSWAADWSQRLFETAESPGVRAAALLTWGQAQCDRKYERGAAMDEGRDKLERVIAEYPDTAAAARAKVVALAHLRTTWLAEQRAFEERLAAGEEPGPDPAVALEPRFRKLADAGVPEARLWLVEAGRSLPAPERLALLGALVEEQPDAPWLGDRAVEAFAALAEADAAERERLARAWLAATTHEPTATRVRLALALMIADERADEARQLLEAVRAADPEGLGRRAAEELARLQ